MADGTPDWNDAWTTHANADAMADAASDDIATGISHDGKWATEVSVQVDYGATATEGVKVYVLRYVSAAVTESGANDAPWGFQMKYLANATKYAVFTVDGTMVSKFSVFATNDSGASVDITCKAR